MILINPILNKARDSTENADFYYLVCSRVMRLNLTENRYSLILENYFKIGVKTTMIRNKLYFVGKIVIEDAIKSIEEWNLELGS